MDFKNYDDIFNKKNYPLFEKIKFLDDYVYVPKDDKPCVCLSGKRYKNCCKKAIEKALKIRKGKNIREELYCLYYKKNKNLLSVKVEKNSINKKNISYCSAHKIFCNCDNDNYNRYSHTISQKNILKNLAGKDNCKVITFNDHKVIDINYIKNNIKEYYCEVLLKDASVTVSFCKKHDRELFVDIETYGNTEYKHTDIENLEYSLKAVSFEVYKKVVLIRYMAQLINENKNVVYNDDATYSQYFNDYYYTQKTLFNIYPLMLKILLEIKNLKEKKVKPKLKTIYFELPGNKVNFSCSEIMYEWKSYCFVNVINSKKPYIIISYYDDDRYQEIEKLLKFKSKFDSLNSNQDSQIESLRDLIIRLIYGAENIYFNITAFNTLSNEEKIYLYSLHRGGCYRNSLEVEEMICRKLIEV